MSFYLMHRGWMNHDAFKGDVYCERSAWLWLIEAAAWKDRRERVGDKMIDIARGELIGSMRFLAQQWRWPKTRVERFLSLLATQGMIRKRLSSEQKSGRTPGVISICNYDKYQMPGDTTGTQPGHNRDTTGTTLKEEKDLKEDSPNGESIPPLSPATPERKNVRRRQPRPSADDWRPSEEHYRLASERGQGPSWTNDQAGQYRDWNRNAKHPHKDCDAGFRNWIRANGSIGVKVNGHRATAVENLYEGAWRAAEAFSARSGIGEPPVEPLLDGDGPTGGTPSADRGLARGSDRTTH